ncbi:hypothetical protein KJ903_02185 [Patescibacteria group bacterium]|nr:hypothetical protein [Patescibacteria group bacterium]
MNIKRLVIALVVATFFGFGCAYGTSTVEIPGFEMTMAYLLTVFYARVLIGFFVGLSGNLKLLKGKYANAALRGAIFGVITSVVISFYGGALIFIIAGVIYGVITDLLATRFSEQKAKNIREEK